MTQKEKQELKEEIKKEIIAELKLADNKKQGNFDFSGYKEEVVRDDIEKLEEFIAVKKWYWYIPLVGFIVYSYQLGQALTSIDRGVLRKNFNKAGLKFLWVDVPFSYIIPLCLLFNYWPFKIRKQMKQAIELTKNGTED